MGLISLNNVSRPVSDPQACGLSATGTLPGKLNAGDYDGATDEFLRWVHAGGESQPGLVRRREAERKLFMPDNNI
ncbi:glycoside hydrolase family protein [Enterobacter asburiae]|uniref:glycoside hydrolase family protein n=1 Tax=Enterobacter asburiae TaxID=61645 RepID=UPI0011D2A7A5